jgi:hypothetical protein
MTDLAAKYQNDPLMRAVVLSTDVEHFINHNKVGMYLMARAVESRADALEKFAHVDPFQAKAVLALQWEQKIPDLFIQWLEEALAAGREAEEQIRIEDEATTNYR